MRPAPRILAWLIVVSGTLTTAGLRAAAGGTGETPHDDTAARPGPSAATASGGFAGRAVGNGASGWGAPIVDLVLLAPEAQWHTGNTTISFGSGPAGEPGRVELVRHRRLEDGEVHENCLEIRPRPDPTDSDVARSVPPAADQPLETILGSLSLQVPQGAGRLEVLVGFEVEAPPQSRALFEVGTISSGQRTPLGRVIARPDRRLDGLWCDVRSLAGGEHTIYLRVVSSHVPPGIALVWARARLTRGPAELTDLLAHAPAARFKAAGVRLAFGRGEGPGWVGWQSNVALADGITYDRVLATYPPPLEGGKIEAAFLVTIPPLGARLAGNVGLPAASRGGSAVRLEWLWETGEEGHAEPLAEPVMLLPGQPPLPVEVNLSARAGRTGFVVARLTIVGRVDRAWPTWSGLRLIEP